MGATLELWPKQATQPRPVFSTFVLTVSDAKHKVYGSAVTFYESFPEEQLTDEQKEALGYESDGESRLNVNKSICLLSHWPFSYTFDKWLHFLYVGVPFGNHERVTVLFDPVESSCERRAPSYPRRTLRPAAAGRGAIPRAENFDPADAGQQGSRHTDTAGGFAAAAERRGLPAAVAQFGIGKQPACAAVGADRAENTDSLPQAGYSNCGRGSRFHFAVSLQVAVSVHPVVSVR